MHDGALLAALPQDYAFRQLAETDSTNSEAQRWLAAGHAPRALFIAGTQTAGRGRRGRSWASPTGNLYASLLVPAPATMQAAGRCGFSISLAIRRAICQAVAGRLPTQNVTLKWPNDVLVAGAKVAGVLLELAEGEAGAGLIIGFGVNIAHAPADTPYQAASLAGRGIAPLDLAAAIVQSFRHYETLPLSELLAAWRACAEGIDAPITVNLPNESVRGVFRGLAGDGALQLEMADGSTRLIHNGDVFFR